MQSNTISDPSSIFLIFDLLSLRLLELTFIFSFKDDSFIFAVSTFFLFKSASENNICLCKFERSIKSLSIRFSSPTPDAAK